MRTRLLPSLAALALLLAAPAGAAVKPGSKTVSQGDVAATLSWQASSDVVAKGGHVRIDRAGRTVLDMDLSKACDLCEYLGDPARSISLRDLDGDGEPEVLVDSYSGGAHCCTTGVFFWFDGTTYRYAVHAFGDSPYGLRDYDGDGRPEILTDDDRFAYEFAGYALSYRPVMLLDWVGHRLVDRTRAFPQQVLVDVHFIDRTLPQARRDGDPRGLIAARMADLALLGLRSHIRPYLRAALRRGDLKGPGPWPSGARFERAVLRFLRKTGYL